MVRSAGLEPATSWFEAKYSIQLSYERALPPIISDWRQYTRYLLAATFLERLHENFCYGSF